jgi:hypothetical protein
MFAGATPCFSPVNHSLRGGRPSTKPAEERLWVRSYRSSFRNPLPDEDVVNDVRSIQIGIGDILATISGFF